MSSLTRLRYPGLLVAAGAAVLGAAVASMIAIAPTGCASDCGNNCPAVDVLITADANVDLPFVDVAWTGPACPSYSPMCRGDDMGTYCTHLDVVGAAAGACDVMIRLADRPPMAIHLEFGPATTQGCCRGFPVLGPDRYVIPVDATDGGGIYSRDGDTDGVSIIVEDAGSTADAGSDAGVDGADGGAAADASDGAAD